MKNLLTLLAAISTITWVIGYFAYDEGTFIHIFLGIAIVSALVRIIPGILPSYA
ncbi:MAG TPA: lmo0937 family membrane protein [Bacteroidia bacterium]